jgi:hypothetical protein
VDAHRRGHRAGILVAAVGTPANVPDRAAFPTLLRTAKRVAPRIAHLWDDRLGDAPMVAGAWRPARGEVDVMAEKCERASR